VSTARGIDTGEELIVPPVDAVRTTLARGRSFSLSGSADSPSFAAALRTRCAAGSIALIHDHGVWLPSNGASAAVARKLKLPWLVSPRGMLEPWALAHRAWRKRIAWLLYQQRNLQNAQVVHATSQQEADNLRRLGLRQPLAVIPNGVEFHPFTKIEACSGQARDVTLSGSRLRTILFLSRIHPKKGLLTLVDAWSKVRPAGWRVVIAGPDEGGHRAVVEAQVSAKGLTAEFAFVGAVEGSAKTALYRAASVFVLPTFSENFGVVVAEALACGVPVITTKGAPWQSLVTHGCGWWVDLGVDPLVEALRQATSMSPEVLRVMGERGRIYAKGAFEWSEIAQQMLDVYRWMVGQGPTPDCLEN